MRTITFLVIRSVVFAALAAAVLAAPDARAQRVDEKMYANLKWRLIGPFRGGRSVACVGSAARPNEFYFGATGGGVWKSTNYGESWECVSDGFFKTSSVGALAVAESDPDIVFAGMGEGCIRGNVAEGDGIYKSSDGGKTWTHMGLEDTRVITRIRIHPKDPNIVYVAALGHVFGPNTQRGVYKTTDGGRTWNRVLFESERAGAVDLCMDAKNPEVLYAATWEAWRTPYTLNSGGPGSKLWKTMDGGRTWKDISRNPGLPTGILGRIGVAVSPVDSNRVYACVEALDGGVFRSDDAGATWRLVSDNRNMRQRAWYYTHIYADPKNVDTLYVLNVAFFKSTNGGASFTTQGTPHSDNHDLWINPNDPQIMINANDGGANVSRDGGRTWSAQSMPTAQFYHVTTDNAYPYRVYGAQQDNSTVRIASRTNTAGIGRDDWTSTAGGESGYIAVKPDDPDVVFGGSYGGLLEMVNHRTGERRNVNAWPDNPMGHGAADLEHRFQWTFPIVFSPNDPNRMYTASQYLLVTTNGGQSWKQISPDLTRNDKSRMGPSGGPITKDNTSVEYYGTIFTVAESPKRRSVIWCGSDDGLVHVTQNDGRTWSNVTPSGMPEWGMCSMIEASPHDPATAYLAVANYKNDDLAPYIYRTRDYGRTWKTIVSGIPMGAFVRVVREDPKRRGLLYAGTERGVFVSFDDGESWSSLQLNLPVTPIHDLAVKEDDLVAATHGRSFWILDDLTPLHQIEAAVGKQAFVFQPRPTPRSRGGGFGGGRRGAGVSASAEPMGQNPMSGMVLNYYLAKPAESVEIEIFDSKGTSLARLANAPKGEGIQRVALPPLRYPGFRGFQGMILWAAGSGPIAAPPGSYRVTLKASGGTGTNAWTASGETVARYIPDPRGSATEADLVAQFELTMKVVARVNDANDAVVRIRDLKRQIGEAVTQAQDEAAIGRDAEALEAKLSDVEEEIYQVRNRSGQDPLNYPIKLNNRLAALIGVIQTGEFRPTDQCYAVFDRLSRLLQAQLDKLAGLVEKDLAALNRVLTAKGLKPITSNARAGASGPPADSGSFWVVFP